MELINNISIYENNAYQHSTPQNNAYQRAYQMVDIITYKKTTTRNDEVIIALFRVIMRCFASLCVV
mgnify:FL=1